MRRKHQPPNLLSIKVNHNHLVEVEVELVVTLTHDIVINSSKDHIIITAQTPQNMHFKAPKSYIQIIHSIPPRQSHNPNYSRIDRK